MTLIGPGKVAPGKIVNSCHTSRKIIMAIAGGINSENCFCKRLTLSRAEPQEACLKSYTSVIPNSRKNPFSKAIIRGADSTIGMYPNLILGVSGACSELIFATGWAVFPPPEAPVFPPGSGGFPKQPFNNVALAVVPAMKMNLRRDMELKISDIV